MSLGKEGRRVAEDLKWERDGDLKEGRELKAREHEEDIVRARDVIWWFALCFSVPAEHASKEGKRGKKTKMRKRVNYYKGSGENMTWAVGYGSEGGIRLGNIRLLLLG